MRSTDTESGCNSSMMLSSIVLNIFLNNSSYELMKSMTLFMTRELDLHNMYPIALIPLDLIFSLLE